MTTLSGFVMVPERTPITGDGHPSENAGLDCVPASLCSGAMYLNSITQLGGTYTPDAWKDEVYGQGYSGGMAASHYVAFCQSLGIRLFAVNGDGAQLVQAAHEHVQQGSPVVFTEPNPYGNPAYTHVCVFFGEEAGFLTAMDPWIAQAITRSDAQWASILLDNQIWVMQKEQIMISIHTPGVPSYFTEVDANHWHCTQTGRTIRFALLDTYKAYGNSALCGLTFLGLPKSDEIPLDANGNCKQYFERGCLVNDPHNIYDKPAGGGGIYPAHVYDDGLGQDPAIPILQQDLADVGKANATLQQELAAAQAQHPQVVGVDPSKVANFQTAMALEAHKITQDAQALEAALIISFS